MILTEQAFLKDIIANNIVYLMKLYNKTRRDVCRDLDIKYTTFTDWVNGNTYPRLDALTELGRYFGVETHDFLVDIESNSELVSRLKSYVAGNSEVTDRNGRSVHGLIDGAEGKGLHAGTIHSNIYGYSVEMIDGELYSCNSQSVVHQSIVSEISYAITSYIKEAKSDYRCFPGQIDIELQVGGGAIVIPDIIVADKNSINVNGTADMGGATGTGDRYSFIPDIVIEVLSKDSRERDTKDKKSLYEAAGVKELWLVNPMNRNTRVYRHDNEDSFGDVQIVEFDECINSTVINGMSIRISDLDILF